MPVYETYTADLLTPVGAHLRIAHKAKYSFLLESVEGGETIARYTFAGANPAEVFRVARAILHARKGRQVDAFRRRSGRTPSSTHPPLSPGARARASSADCRSDRLFCLRHGAAGRAHTRNRPRRCGPRRLRDDVLSRLAGVRSRAAPRLDDSQRVHRRTGQPAREIRRGGSRNSAHAADRSKDRCPSRRERGARDR